MIDKATAQRIKDTADIVDVVKDYVHLTKRGANYMGLCPFHNERTPSFSVNPRRNFCYCFSCHKGGSPVNFLMELEGISYHDALLRLAEKYGIEVKERELTDEEKAKQSLRESLLIANEWAMKKMNSWLTDEKEGRNVGLQYFYSRGITDEAIKAFRLGYALDSGFALRNAAEKEKYDPEVLHTLGLLGKSQQTGTLYDRFRGRVIFPIINGSGKVVAFGGRDLKGGNAKYINSPESPVYKKSNELYGMYQAKGAIGKMDKCFLVEGYMDVIGMWQSGMENVVASSGTALTDGQIALIHRFTENITLIYDGDPAGIKASLRGIDMLLANKMNVKVLLLPDGHDPDSFARAHTPEEFREYVKEHETDIIRFKVQALMQDAGSDPLQRSTAIRSIVNTLSVIPDAIKRNVYVQECSRLLGIDEAIIVSELASGSPKEKAWGEEVRVKKEELSGSSNSESAKAQRQPTAGTSLRPFEKEILRYCVRYGMLDFCEGVGESGEVLQMNVYQFIKDEMELDNVTFTNEEYGRVFEMIGGLQDLFEADYMTHTGAVERELQRLRKEGYDAIAQKSDLDLKGIEKEEQKLEASLADYRSSRMKEFAQDYIGRQLASDEDDNVRRIVNELITNKYHLSRYHSKTAKIETEAERLDELIPRALTEWKNGILQEKLSETLRKMDEASAAGDLDRLVQLQKKAAKLIEIRKNVAKDIGERIISPADRF